jgi:hypothetical protein
VQAQPLLGDTPLKPRTHLILQKHGKSNQSKKGGRPIRPDGLAIVIRIRMTQEDFDMCKEKAQQANLPLSKFARIMILDIKSHQYFFA